MGNFFAHFMLAVWPLIAIVITRKKTPDTAVILLFLVPYLILPPTIALSTPITSALDKYIIPSLAALFIMRCRYGAVRLWPNVSLVRVLMVLLVLSPLFTLLYNRDPIFLANRVIPGLSVKDALNMELVNFCWIYVPFCLGFTWLRDAESHMKLLAIVAMAGLVYSIPMLWEIRMSPQLNAKIYGFVPSGFDQQIREGGFRPVVFLEHGLRVAVFFSMSVMAAIVLTRSMHNGKNSSKKSRIKLGYMLLVMILCKTLSALIYVTLAMAIFFTTKPKAWARFSVIIVTMVFIFPFIRNSDWFPVHQISDFFTSYNEERGASLQYRFDNEDILLERASQRSLAGWGGWGRSRVYNEMGQDISVTDGIWIIVFGASGWLGYIAQFGLIFIPVLLVFWTFRSNKMHEVPMSTAGIFVLLAFNMIDLIPNSSAMPFNYLLAGALMGYAKQPHAVAVAKRSSQKRRNYQLSCVSKQSQVASVSSKFDFAVRK